MNVADTPDEARRYMRKYGWTWPSIRDPRRERAKRLGASYQPHVILLDANGRVVASHEGTGRAEDWEALLDRL